MPTGPSIQTRASQARHSQALSYVLFAATAFGVVLPGTLLPQLLARWSLTDSQGGVLLFLAFLTSSGSALLARGNLARAAAVGCAAAGAGSLGLAFASHGACFLAVSVLGFGLGLTMTSVTLLQSRRHAETRSAELSRLNLLWSVGACLAPSLLLQGAARWSLTIVLIGLGVALLALAALAALRLVGPPPMPASAVAGASPAASASPPRLPYARGMLVLLLLIPLATGVETSLGGWLTTYSRRSGMLAEGAATTVTCLWFGLLLGRLAHSFPAVTARWQRATILLAPWLLSAATAALLLVHSGWSMMLSALAAGFALGPLYPLTLALWLERNERGNLAFLIAGCGAAALPLLTGIVSQAAHSLTRGLLVPLAASVLLAALAASLRSLAGRRERPLT